MTPNPVNGSAPEPIPMRDRDRAEVFKFPCDGIERYTVKRAGLAHPPRSTYSDAYETLFLVTGGKMAADGGRIFSLEGVRRIKALNRAYIAVAGEFIRNWFVEDKKKREAEKQKPSEPAA